MPYLYNHESEGGIHYVDESSGVYVTVYYENEDNEQWEMEHRLRLNSEGKIISPDDPPDPGNAAFELIDWEGSSTDVNHGFEWSDVFTVLWSEAELNVRVSAQLRAKAAANEADPLVGLLREVAGR